MPLTNLDATWFKIHSDRMYRLRRQTAAEMQQWPAPPREGLDGWCVTRKADGATKAFALSAGAFWCDCDACLEALFVEVAEAAA